MQGLIFVLKLRSTKILLRNINDSLNMIQGFVTKKTAIKFSTDWRIRAHYVPVSEQTVMRMLCSVL